MRKKTLNLAPPNIRSESVCRVYVGIPSMFVRVYVRDAWAGIGFVDFRKILVIAVRYWFDMRDHFDTLILKHDNLVRHVELLKIKQS